MWRWLGRNAGYQLLSLVVPLVLLGVWEWLSRASLINRLFFPPPSEVANRLVDLVSSGQLMEDVVVTTLRIAVGFALGAIPGALIGIMMGVSWPVRVALLPAVNALYPLPRIALLPLVLVIFGITEQAMIFMIAFSVFFVVLLNTLAGVSNLDRVYLDVARNLGAKRWRIYISVALPGSLPFILAGARLAVGLALIVIVGTEFLSAHQGVGALIWRSYQILDIRTVYVGLFLSGLLGWALNLVLNLVERLLIPWQPRL